MIRKMVISDIPLMISLGAEMHQESRYSNLDFDPNRLWSLGEQIIKTPDNYLAAVYEKIIKLSGFALDM